MTTVWLILAIIGGLMNLVSAFALVGVLAVYTDLRAQRGRRGARLRVARLVLGALLMATLTVLALSLIRATGTRRRTRSGSRSSPASSPRRCG